MSCHVIVREILERVIYVDTEDIDEALEIIEDEYLDAKWVLTADDHKHTILECHGVEKWII